MTLKINSIHNIKPGERVVFIVGDNLVEGTHRYECNGYARIEGDRGEFWVIRNHPVHFGLQVLTDVSNHTWSDTLLDIVF